MYSYLPQIQPNTLACHSLRYSQSSYFRHHACACLRLCFLFETTNQTSSLGVYRKSCLSNFNLERISSLQLYLKLRYIVCIPEWLMLQEIGVTYAPAKFICLFHISKFYLIIYRFGEYLKTNKHTFSSCVVL